MLDLASILRVKIDRNRLQIQASSDTDFEVHAGWILNGAWMLVELIFEACWYDLRKTAIL